VLLNLSARKTCLAYNKIDRLIERKGIKQLECIQLQLKSSVKRHHKIERRNERRSTAQRVFT
jgi:hypothetical protein